MKKLLKMMIAASAMTAVSMQASADYVYNVSGDWVDLSTDVGNPLAVPPVPYTPAVGIGMSSGAFTDSATGADFHISGYVTTNTNTVGYEITGGLLSASGYAVIPYAASPTGLLYQYWWGVTGTPTNAGVVWDAGTFCLGFFGGETSGTCSVGPTGFTDVSTTNMAWDGSGTFNSGYYTTQGLQLTGGAGGAMFTVAQPGDLTPGPAGNVAYGATGIVIVGGGNLGAYFLGGDLTLTQVPVPAAAWLFGSALVGLVGIGRRRKA